MKTFTFSESLFGPLFNASDKAQKSDLFLFVNLLHLFLCQPYLSRVFYLGVNEFFLDCEGPPVSAPSLRSVAQTGGIIGGLGRECH